MLFSKYISATSKKEKWAVRILMVFLIFAFIHPFLANDVALIRSSTKGIEFPVIKKILGNSIHQVEKVNWEIKTLIPYSAQQIDIKNSNYKSPFAKQNVDRLSARHWLGTDKLGRDTLAGLLYGCWVALLVGFFASFFSVALGISIGLFAGYYGNNGIRMNLVQILILSITSILMIYGITTGYFYGSNIDFILEFSFIFFLGVLSYLLIRTSSKLNIQSYPLPIDNIVLRVLEIFKSIPGLFLVLALLAIIKVPSVYHIIWIIAIVGWPMSCRYTRAEVLATKEEDYIKSAHSLGIPNLHILSKHILPNVISPAIISFAFGVSSAIVVEATLSFLGLGLSADQVTWGSMLSEVRSYYKAWWLVLFPGILLFAIVTSFNTIGEKINKGLRNTT